VLDRNDGIFNRRANPAIALTKRMYLECSPLLRYIIKVVYESILARAIIVSLGYVPGVYLIKGDAVTYMFDEFITFAIMWFVIGTTIQYEICNLYIASIVCSAFIYDMIGKAQHTFNVDCKTNAIQLSSFLQLPFWLRVWTHGQEYHHVHHFDVSIPGYNLQSYHDEFVTKSVLFDNIYKPTLRDVYNNRQLLLFDEEHKKYISFGDADTNRRTTISTTEQLRLNETNMGLIKAHQAEFKNEFVLYGVFKMTRNQYYDSDTRVEFEPIPDTELPDVVCCHCLSTALRKGNENKQSAVVRVSSNFPNSKYIHFTVGDILYYVICQDGIVRFVVNNQLSTIQKLLLCYVESKNISDMCLNMRHKYRHGCFCLGLPAEDSDGNVILQRYNRWNEDMHHCFDFVPE
jgi:hypothetical protein